MAVGAERRSKLPYYTGNGDVSVWVKILEWDDKPKTNIKTIDTCTTSNS